jgi:serine/threonine protein kinase
MLDNQFELMKQIGKGGSSQVFSARDFHGNKFAIKIIRKDKCYSKEKAEHFILRESIVYDKVGHHDNIVQSYICSIDGILEFEGNETSVMYHVLELCPNGTLASIIRSTGPLEETIAKFQFHQLVSSVLHLHRNAFAHLDIKLDNILLDEFYNLKLADLGTAY